MNHDLKCSSQFFEHVITGAKPFEIRRNDRGFVAGDLLLLREYNSETYRHTGRCVWRRITYVTDFMQQPGCVVFGMEKLPELPGVWHIGMRRLANFDRGLHVARTWEPATIVGFSFSTENGQPTCRLRYDTSTREAEAYSLVGTVPAGKEHDPVMCPICRSKLALREYCADCLGRGGIGNWPDDHLGVCLTCEGGGEPRTSAFPSVWLWSCSGCGVRSIHCADPSDPNHPPDLENSGDS